jgi:hypothetical protein
VLLLVPFWLVTIYKSKLNTLFLSVRNAYIILIRKPEGKRALRRPQGKWEDNIKMYLRETGWEVVDWIHLAQNRDQWWVLVNMVMNL